jgi:GNAT superfamily N-acetyltransferase
VPQLFIACDGDGIGKIVGISVLSNDPETLRRISNKIEAGNDAIRSWVTAGAGTIIESGGDECYCEINSSLLQGLQAVRDTYFSATGCSLSVGVGTTLSDAGKALMVAKIRGKNRVIYYSKDMDAELEAIKPKKEETKIAEAYLNKSESDVLSRFQALADGQHSKDRLEQQTKEGKIDQIRQEVATVLEQLKTQLPFFHALSATYPDAYQSILAVVRGIVNLGRELSTENLAKSVASIKPVNKQKVGAETAFDYSHILPESAKGMKLNVFHAPGEGPYPPQLTAVLHHNGKDVGHVMGLVSDDESSMEPHSDLAKEYHGKGLGQSMYEALYAHAKNHVGVSTVTGGTHSAAANAVHQRLAQKHGFRIKGGTPIDGGSGYVAHDPYSYALKSEYADCPDTDLVGPGRGVVFGKEMMDETQPVTEIPGVLDKVSVKDTGDNPTKTNAHLPVGTTHNGKMKIVHDDGRTSLVSVTGGMVQGTKDAAPLLGANSHPVSSHRPEGR